MILRVSNRIFFVLLILAALADAKSRRPEEPIDTVGSGDTVAVFAAIAPDVDTVSAEIIDTLFLSSFDSLTVTTLSDSAAQSDSLVSEGSGVGITEAAHEEAYQESIDSLFSDQFEVIDSFALDTRHINAGRFNSAEWTDTARIVLVDSTRRRLYTHPAEGHITSNFGQRRYLWHYGVDTKLYKGDTVRAAFDGAVRVTQYDRRGYGHVVVLRHASGLETLYGHLSKKLVEIGDTLKSGDAVGLGGSTGRSTGSHLHFEMRYRGEPFNPHAIVDFVNYRLKSDTLLLTKENFTYLIELRKMKWMTVRRGDTLGHIALRYHTTITKLCQLNGITRKTILRVGQKLRYQ